MEEQQGVNPDRLFAVADLVLELIEAKGGAMCLLELAMTPMTGAGCEPGSVPTQTELDEAISLLFRMGFIEPADRPAGT